MRSLIHHHSTWHARQTSAFWLFEVSVLLHVIATSLINIFIPILLYEHGYSIPHIIWFYVLFNAIDVPLNFGVDLFIRRFGARSAMIASIFFQIAFLVLLSAVVPSNAMQFAALALLMALYDCFFWIGHLYLFAESGRKDSPMGEETGIIYAVRQIASIVGPALGGLLLVFHHNDILIGVCVVLLAFSLVPLFSMRGVRYLPARKRSVWPIEFLRDGTNRRNTVNMFLFGFHDVADSVLWPLFILITLGSLSAVAVLAVLASWSTVLFSYLTGRLSNRFEAIPMVVGGALVTLLWLGRALLHAQSFYYLSLIVMGFASLMVMIPVDKSIASHAKGADILAAYTYRNAAGMTSELLVFLALAFLVSVFKTGFVLAALAMFLVAFLAALAGVRASSSS